MSRPRRWPLHPKPSPGEALSSWLTRLARLYDLSLPELLRHNLGAPVDIRTPGEVDRLNLDVDPLRGCCPACRNAPGSTSKSCAG